jgi:hypothetical protein
MLDERAFEAPGSMVVVPRNSAQFHCLLQSPFSRHPCISSSLPNTHARISFEKAGPFASTSSPMVVPALNLVFCAAAKVGSSEWRPLWGRVKLEVRWPQTIDTVPGAAMTRLCCAKQQSCCHLNISHPHLQLRDLSVGHASLLTNDNSWSKAAYVRDPVLRLLSAWINKFRNQKDNPVSLQLYRTNLGLPGGFNLSTIPFSEFVDRIGAQSPEWRNIHWNSQYLNCNIGKYVEAYHFIGCFENIADEYSVMMDAIIEKASQKITDHPERESIIQHTKKIFEHAFAKVT